ncbi:MAG: SIR2 family protein, partial [Pyrinomonadaceae bacterium]
MTDADSNIPKSLIDALKAGEVVPFVGAGVSIAVKKKNADGTESEESLFPSWKGYVGILAQTLIEEGKLDEANLVEAYIKSAKPKYLEAMQHAFEELPKEVWFRKLNEYFKKNETEAVPDSLELSKLIWQLGSNLIFTTNIDRVLEWKSVKEPPIEILDTQKVESAELQADKNPSPTIFYLHGRVGDKDNIVFTREQYDDFYKKNENEAKLRTLQAFLTTKSFLFIGFSLDDAYFVEELKHIHEIYRGGAKQYYALIKKSDKGRLKDFDFVTEVYFEDIGEPLLEVARKMRDYADKNKDGETIPPTSKIPVPDKDKPFFNVPYNSKGGEFVGRKGKMKEIRSLLGQDGCASIGQAVSVKGFGGLGKTQLAVEYAHEYRSEYKNGVFWLVADENIDNQLLQIADKQGWINQYDKTVNQLDVAKARFLELSECLIIFDNVEGQDDIKDYLPKPDSRTHILITSRYKQSSFRQVDLELLERDESRELLLKISKRNPQEEAEKEHLENILKTLGDIPLAIELVGGYLAEHEIITFTEYHQFLNDIPLSQLEEEFPEGNFTNHDRSIIRTLRISKKTIKEKPLMVEILKVL